MCPDVELTLLNRIVLACAACMLLGACATTPEPGAGPVAAAATPAAATGPTEPATGVLPADAALSCDQITTQVEAQNAIVNSAGATAAAAHKGTTTSQTAGVSEMSEMDAVRAAAADRKGTAATLRAKQLVAMGKQKHCYKD